MRSRRWTVWPRPGGVVLHGWKPEYDLGPLRSLACHPDPGHRAPNADRRSRTHGVPAVDRSRGNRRIPRLTETSLPIPLTDPLWSRSGSCTALGRAADSSRKCIRNPAPSHRRTWEFFGVGPPDPRSSRSGSTRRNSRPRVVAAGGNDQPAPFCWVAGSAISLRFAHRWSREFLD